MISFTIGRRLNMHQCAGSQVHVDREQSANLGAFASSSGRCLGADA